MSEVALACANLRKIYVQGAVEVPVLLGVELSVAKGAHVAIVGASGSGKSTLLGLLAGLDSATSGTVRLLGRALDQLDEDARAALRAHLDEHRIQMHGITVDGSFASWQRLTTRLVLHGPVTKFVPESLLQTLRTDVWVTESLAADVEKRWDKGY